MKQTTSRILVIVATAAFLCGLVSSMVCAAQQAQGALADVLVKEKDSLGIESEKAPFDIDIDVLKEILPIDTTLLEVHQELPHISTASFFQPLESPGTVSPWLYAIARTPAVSFPVADLQADIARWELVIVDMEGTPVHRLTGKGPIAAEIAWDGRDAKGRFLRVGEIYSYFLNTVDRAGTRKTGITRPFSVTAAVHREKKQTIISCMLPAVFNKYPLEISEEGKQLLTEAADIVKAYHPASCSINVYDETSERAHAEAALAAQYLSQHIMKSLESIPCELFPSTPANRRIDIVIHAK